jgi:hypothetical protein
VSSFADYKPQARFDALSYAARLYEALDTPTSLKCAILLKYGEHRQLVEASIDSSQYSDPDEYFRSYQAVKLLSKYPYLSTGIDLQKVAEKKFIWAEAQCRETNRRFRDQSSVDFPPRVSSILFRMQRKIALILGDVPSLEVLDFSFGPGANYGVRGDTSVFAKISSDLECTFAFADSIVEDFLSEFPGWVPSGPAAVKLVRGSQLTFVPKDAKTMRPICIEPLLNGLYQKGVGSYIRDRLLRWGVNLRDQAVNQRLAKEALESRLATVDFSSASDTIAYALVLNLLPWEWFEFLDRARSPSFEHEGKWYDFQKFTSMGNAYTFELETLIFFAMACAVCEEIEVPYTVGEHLAVYGDDVIIPQEAFLLFQEVSSVCGFTLNAEKSFTSGTFFESCGHDYYKGYNVRPYLVKKRVKTLHDAFYVANCVRAIKARYSALGMSKAYSTRLRVLRHLDDVWRWVVGCIPRRARFQGPIGFGDGHLHSEWDESSPKRHQQWCGWTFKTLAVVPESVLIGYVPIGYALYDTRRPGQSVSPFGFNYDRIRWLDEVVPFSPDKGDRYSLRGGNASVDYQLTEGFCLEWTSCINWEPCADREIVYMEDLQLRTSMRK